MPGQPQVATYLFYWYNSDRGIGFQNAQGKHLLTHHPWNPVGYSWDNPDWYYRELKDMASAGIDIVLPVYWGYPGGEETWSFVGLAPLVEAERRLLAEGVKAPKIGLFESGAGLVHNQSNYQADFTTEEGREWLYQTVKLFFERIPRDLWATVEGRPLVVNYTNEHRISHDDTWPGYLRARFEQEFGVQPYLVKDASWSGPADSAYCWGSALYGPSDFGVATLGPGFDSSAVNGPDAPKRDREEGAFYRRSWEWLLARPFESRSKLVLLETWNELFEGTDLCHSHEYGRDYIRLTRRYAEAFHRGEVWPSAWLPLEASLSLGETNTSAGLTQTDVPDGVTEPVVVEGVSARRTLATDYEGRYMLFAVDDFLPRGKGVVVEVQVTCLDDTPGELLLEYDSLDTSLPYTGRFKSAGLVKRKGKGGWMTATFKLVEPAFANRLHGQDIRLVDISKNLTVKAVQLKVLRWR